MKIKRTRKDRILYGWSDLDVGDVFTLAEDFDDGDVYIKTDDDELTAVSLNDGTGYVFGNDREYILLDAELTVCER